MNMRNAPGLEPKAVTSVRCAAAAGGACFAAVDCSKADQWRRWRASAARVCPSLRTRLSLFRQKSQRVTWGLVAALQYRNIATQYRSRNACGAMPFVANVE